MKAKAIKQLFFKYRAPTLVFLLAVGFFFASSSYNFLTQGEGYHKWNSPDETANYFFAMRLAQTGEISSFDRVNLLAHDLVHPRSMRSDDGWLKPVSFLGIIVIFGFLGRIFSPAVIPYLTPLFGALGIIAMYLFASRFFSRRVGVISAFLLAFLPPYFFYSARSMFHNVLFTVFIIFFVWLIWESISLRRQKTKFLSWRAGRAAWLGNICAFGAGIFLGGAVFVRTSELVWLGPALFLAWIFNIRRFGLSRLLFLLSGITLGVIPMLYFNQWLFGGPLFGGYSEMNRSLAAITQAGGQLSQGLSASSDFFKTVFDNVFYFGFKFRQSMSMFWHYAVDMFPWLFWLSFAGGWLLLVRNFVRFRRRDVVYLLLLILVGAILVFYYGSWKFNDNPNVNHYTIGNSYTRYWLPMYAFALPLAALAIASLARTVSKMIGKKNRALVSGLIVFFSVFWLSYNGAIFSWFGSEEGIIHLYYNSLRDKVNLEKTAALLPEGAVVVTQYHDKHLFPEHRVVVGLLSDDNMNYYYRQIAKVAPLYYYNFTFPEKDMAYLNEKKLPVFNLRISPVSRIDRAFTLYRLEESNDENEKLK